MINKDAWKNNGRNFYKDGRTKWFIEHPAEKRLYHIWIGMRRRAGGNRYKKDKTDRHAKIYVNLTVASEWNDWTVFYEWAKNNGWKPGLTIDRIDNEKGYSPDNCRWVSREENNRNRRCVNKFFYNGEFLTLPQIAQIYRIPRDRLYERVIKRGYSLEDAIFKPLKAKPSNCSKEEREKRDKNIKTDRKKGVALAELAAKYNLSTRRISEIINT